MLRIIQNSAPAGAKSYFSTADYYTQGQELVGIWHGKGAQRLGLVGEVEKGDWDALCDNLDPRTGQTLTARQRAGRRVGYDFNFHVPKSMSLLYALTEDERLLAAFQEAVGETMGELEVEMQTRIRRDGRDEDRVTGNMVWGEFVHTTARPVGGVPDPHLHAHCFVFNATYDGQEGQWKAGQFAGIKRDAGYFEAVFHSKLAGKLADLGLPVERTAKGWELAGVTPAVRKAFSRRTTQIEREAAVRGIDEANAKGELGARTREKKAKELSMIELQQLWWDRLDAEGSEAIRALSARIGTQGREAESGRAHDAVGLAVDHCFERASVVPERVLLARALKNAYGDARPPQVALELSRRKLLKAERDGRHCVTTPEVLAEERAMIAFARDGRGVCRELAPGEHVFTREWLSDDQRRATQRILGSRDRVVILRGGAGAGKTSMMQETVAAIEVAGLEVFTFAPSADASRGVLRQEGFATADTVARLLLDKKLQGQIRGQVIWVDEAGLLGARSMKQLFDLAGRLDARVVLSGDRRQHGSVDRGAALRLLETEAGLVPAEIKQIQRQKGAYKRAVASLSRGDTAAGFRQLDQLGWIREVDDTERYQQLAADYVEAVGAGGTALCVSPTHGEADRVTQEVRARLRSDGKLGGQALRIPVLKAANLTEAERADPVHCEQGDVLVFHQNAKGFTKGDRFLVGEGVYPSEAAARFGVFRPGELEVAPGDMLRVTRNGCTADGRHRLNNGALVTVKGFTRSGDIELANGWVINRDYGHLAHGYCVTSHASQGKTVDQVLIAQGAESFPAGSAEQFYVSASRGRKRATVYTDSREELLRAVDRSDERVSATELMRQRARLQARSAQPVPEAHRGRAVDRERAHG